MKIREASKNSQNIAYYIRRSSRLLLLTTISGILCNVGLTATPWFEGQLIQKLFNIIKGESQASEMLILSLLFLCSEIIIQGLRYLKRLYVRKFSNEINREMKVILYKNLLLQADSSESTGTWMTKAISDVDNCSEGIRKFTTEFFDTGVAMISYFVMLMIYDWRLAIISCIFPPLAVLLAERMKKIVVPWTAAGREAAEALNGATVDRITNAITYRVYGVEDTWNEKIEEQLTDYEQKSSKAHILENGMPPIYRVISMISGIFILYFGGKNVLGIGWTVWDIAAFSTFLSAFNKNAIKISKAAKLINIVQSAKVSWGRIRPYLHLLNDKKVLPEPEAQELKVEDVSFSHIEGEPVFSNISFSAKPGQIIGVTGEVASGKTSLGLMFLKQGSYTGHIYYGKDELKNISEDAQVFAYMGHKPNLFSESIKDNVLLSEGNTKEELDALNHVLQMVAFEDELNELSDGVNTRIGNGGIRLSGGQQARIALARTLYHKQPVLILDDPFSAVDMKTEEEIFNSIREEEKNRIIILISHRLNVFNKCDGVLFLQNRTGIFGSHAELLENNPDYKKLVLLQEGGESDEA
ncbi:MAG: ABC transporter ATP-binding protein/permease [Clostridia bacterium]|nr:ABC transporter ATP-binding protein/permease [Clostridia bacterium]